MSGPFQIEEYVRWSDVDAAGVICYGAYVRFIEIAETEMFRAAGYPYGKVFEQFDCWLPRVRYACDFRRPAKLDERLKVSAFVNKIGRTSLTLGFTFDNDSDERVADCEIVLVCVDRHDFQPKKLPEEFKVAMNRFVRADKSTFGG